MCSGMFLRWGLTLGAKFLKHESNEDSGTGEIRTFAMKSRFRSAITTAADTNTKCNAHYQTDFRMYIIINAPSFKVNTVNAMLFSVYITSLKVLCSRRAVANQAVAVGKVSEGFSTHEGSQIYRTLRKWSHDQSQRP